jgi:hypothetical protein
VISLGVKYADYGLTGGFAICGQAALLFWIAPDKARSIIAGSATFLGDYFRQLPEGLVTPASAVITAVAVISIFFLGLILELIGSVAVIWEANVFKRHLERHRSWLSGLLANYSSSTVDDLNRVVSEFGSPLGKKDWRDTLRIFTLWKRSSRKTVFGDQRAVQRFKLLRPISRIQSLLLSYVLAADKAPHLELLRDNLQLCRTSRAISAVLYILSIESILWMPFNLIGRPNSGLVILVSYFLGLVMVVLAIFLPVKAYARFCDSLFALVLVLSQKLSKQSGVPACSNEI